MFGCLETEMNKELRRFARCHANKGCMFGCLETEMNKELCRTLPHSADGWRPGERSMIFISF